MTMLARTCFLQCILKSDYESDVSEATTIYMSDMASGLCKL